jgi:putative lipoprotein (rSAM/lipoprotein system)
MSLTTKIIAKILMLCGISLTCTACYAMPSTGYMMNIEGMVYDEASGKPIEGIKIRSNDGQHIRNGASDAEGKFQIIYGTDPPLTLTVTVEDIDGPENGGEWAMQINQVEVTEKNFAPSANGLEGHWEVDFALTLKPQSNENE